MRNPVLVIGIFITVAATVATMIYGRGSTPAQSGGGAPAYLVAKEKLTRDAILDIEKQVKGTGRFGVLTTAEQQLAEKLKGKLLTKDVEPGGSITEADVKPPPPLGQPPPIPLGLRGLWVRLADEPAGPQQMVRTGDYVDVLGIGNSGASPIVAQRVLVLKRFDTKPVEKSGDKEAVDAGAIFVLGVTSQEATRIAEAEKSGHLRFLLRSPDDLRVTTPIRTPPAHQAPTILPPPKKPNDGASKKLNSGDLKLPLDTDVDVLIIRGSEKKADVVPR